MPPALDGDLMGGLLLALLRQHRALTTAGRVVWLDSGGFGWAAASLTAWGIQAQPQPGALEPRPAGGPAISTAARTPRALNARASLVHSPPHLHLSWMPPRPQNAATPNGCSSAFGTVSLCVDWGLNFSRCTCHHCHQSTLGNPPASQLQPHPHLPWEPCRNCRSALGRNLGHRQSTFAGSSNTAAALAGPFPGPPALV